MLQKGRNSMRSVKLNTKQLLKIVNENKEKHVKEYLEAIEDYKVAVLKISSTNLKLAKTGDLAKFGDIESIPTSPRSYEKEYLRAISMLELSVDVVVELEDAVFNQLVLDEWQWKNQFQLSNQGLKSYSSW
jgi:fibronectin type 3 domain-containing protein